MSSNIRKLKLASLGKFATPFNSFNQYIDSSGSLIFQGKAKITSSGVSFEDGACFNINKENIQVLSHLGKGQYGIVNKCIYSPTSKIMAVKEIRLELNQIKLNQIIMELDVLHKSLNCPYIVDFFGAYFVDGCDAGSVDRLYLNGTPEPILAKIVISVLKALKFLKDEIQIIHRDVKPTNILVNSLGQCKLCDFGISGQLFQSLAKTNIGCQSYLAPERISVQEIGVFTSSCDVWSLGITAIEIALGYYPYPSDNFDSVFAQLNYIVVGEVPGLNEDYSKECRDFISLCLKKDPKIRANYKELVEHEWVKKWENEDVDVATWVKGALESNVNEVRISSSYPL